MITEKSWNFAGRPSKPVTSKNKCYSFYELFDQVQMSKPFLLRHGMEVTGGQSNIKSEVNEQIHTIPKLKEGFDLVYVMVDFICIGFVDL